ncbi:MAG: hypothetical protein ITF99_03925 [Chryseobacterium sp.]|nr:hypothetical protein [Chryseobacterium sp.]
MKTIKKTVIGLSIISAGVLSAQSADMRNMIKVGANVGMAVPQENTSAAVGMDVAYQHLGVPGFGLGIATGYTHYFGRENTVNGITVNNNDFGVVPVAALIRVYPKQTGFYFGTDLGYGFIVGDNQVASNIGSPNRPDGGFYLKPEIGYHNKDWNFAVHYQKVFTGSTGEIGSQKYNAGSLGLGVAYNIPLGSGTTTVE